MIEVKNLVRYYGANPAVRDVSFSVKEGEILGFLVPMPPEKPPPCES